MGEPGLTRARLVTILSLVLRRREADKGPVTTCIGVGQGTATATRREGAA